MSVAVDHSASRPGTESSAPREGIQRKLLRSHLVIAGIGFGLVFIALAMTLWLRDTALSLASESGPSVHATMRTLEGIQRSLANLRGWVALPSPHYQEEWRRVWSEDIRSSVDELEHLDASMADTNALAELHDTLDQLHDVQWYVQDVAWTPGNEPARAFYDLHVQPIAHEMTGAVSRLMESVRRPRHGVTEKHLSYLGAMADLRFALTDMQVELLAFLTTGHDNHEQAYYAQLAVARARIQAVREGIALLTDEERQTVRWLHGQVTVYSPLVEEVIRLRRSPQWNVAQHLMATQLQPLALRASEQLTALNVVYRTAMVDDSVAVTRMSQMGFWLLLALSGGMGVAAFLVSRSSARRLAVPITQLSEMASRWETELNEEEIPLTSVDEVNDFTCAFQEMRRSLRSREEQLRLAAAQTQGIIDSARDAIITINESCVIQTCNAAAGGMFGYPVEDLLGLPLSWLMPLSRREEYDSYLEQYVLTNIKNVMGQRIVVEGERHDGTQFPMDLSISELSVGAHRVFTVIMRDITQQKLAEGELIHARDEALASATTKAAFLANMSHEIRTPMNGIIGMTSLLLESGLNADQEDYALTVQRSGEHLLTLINDILDFSKIEAGKLDIDEVDFDLRVLVEEVLDLFSDKAHQKGLDLTGLIHDLVPTALRGDPGRIRQILVNLIGNAVKFTGYGEVVVEVTLHSREESHVRLHAQVSDTGVGFPQSQVNRLFESFTQADATTTREYGGTGLGLAICRQLTSLMGGSIGATSQPGVGSHFWFTVCMGEQSSPQERLPSDSLAGLRVCVVEQNASTSRLIRQYADRWDMTAVCVADVADGWTQLRTAAANNQPFDVALIDSRVRTEDGALFARAVREDTELAALPVVLLTSRSSRMQGGQDSGREFAGCVMKPLRQAQLYRCIAGAVGRSDETVVQPQAARSADRGGVPDLARHGDVRLLLAEDNAVNQKVLVRMLKKLGLCADVVETGKDAVAAAAQTAYDLIFMDCHMPEMDGYQATAEIRRLEVGGRHTPIVALTADAMKGAREKCLQAGMDDFVTKPISQTSLAQVLSRFFAYAISREQDDEVSNRLQPSPRMSGDAVAGPVNVRTLQALRQEHEPPSQFESVVQQFMENGADNLNTIRHAIEQENAHAVIEPIRALKGSGVAVGAETLVQLAWELERQLQSATITELASLVVALSNELDRVKDHLVNVVDAEHGTTAPRPTGATPDRLAHQPAWMQRGEHASQQGHGGRHEPAHRPHRSSDNLP